MLLVQKKPLGVCRSVNALSLHVYIKSNRKLLCSLRCLFANNFFLI